MIRQFINATKMTLILLILCSLTFYCSFSFDVPTYDSDGKKTIFLLASSQIPTSQPSTAPISYSTPGIYSFTVPSGVQYLIANLYGAAGVNDAQYGAQNPAGKGARIQMKVTAVTAGQVLQVTVGSQGGSYGAPGASSTCSQGSYGGAGGGYTSLVDKQSSTLIAVAGGGGGGGNCKLF